MKSYTDLEQSKKLAEILPIESADMEFMFLKRDGSEVSNVPFVKNGFEEPECCYIFIPCWSLAALFSVFPEISGANLKFERVKAEDGYNGHYYHLEYENKILILYSKNLVDACYEMIIRLHELKML